MPRTKGGVVGANRLLARLRHLFNWAIAQGYVDHSPFKRHGVTVVKLNGAAETPRDRRLDEGDEEKLIAAAGPRTQAIIIAALETGCRIGELLSLQWGQVRWTEGYILLNAAKTKTNEARSVPMTSRMRGVLEMRRTDISGEDFPATAYVFGNRVGARTSYAAFKKGWKRAYTKAGITGLHFHDLRREFASRLLETPGVSLHDVADWVGHSNVTTTSRYLRTTGVRRQHIARKFEESRRLQIAADTGSREPPSSSSSITSH
jgi:integrase